MEHTDVGATNAPGVPGDVGAGGGTGSSGGAADTARQAASETSQQARNVAESAADGARDVAQTAKEQAAEVAMQAKEEGRNLVEEARSQLRQQAQSQTRQIAGKLREISDEMRALAEGRPEQATRVRSYAEDAASKVSELAQRVDSSGFDGIVEDVKSFARRRPAVFLASAALAGFGIGRLVRNANGAAQTSTATPQMSGTMATPQTTGLTPGAQPAVEGPAVSRGDLSTTELPTGLV